jgi:hypothetical protein
MDDDDFALLEQFVRMVLDETAALLNKSADQFVASLQEWLDDLLNHPIPEDWRAELARFVEHGIYYGMQMLPESLRTVEDIIAARVAGTGPFVAIGPAPRDAAAMAAGPRIVINADPLITMPAHWKPPERRSLEFNLKHNRRSNRRPQQMPRRLRLPSLQRRPRQIPSPLPRPRNRLVQTPVGRSSPPTNAPPMNDHSDCSSRSARRIGFGNCTWKRPLETLATS